MSHQSTLEPITRDVRVAIIGYGRWGRQCHAHLIERAPGLKLHGIASGDAAKREQIRATHNCLAYENFKQAIDDADVDVIVLATPNDTHCDFSTRALQAGKHVVTDKVMCLDMDECNRMTEAAQVNNRLLTVFQNRRLDGDFRTLQTAMQDGTLGEVRWVEMAWQGMGPWGGWRGQMKSGGGKFYDLGAHLVDQMQLLFPQPVESVFCRMHHDFESHDIESECLIIIAFEGGCTGVVDLSSRAALSKPRFYAHGERATLWKEGLDPQENALIAGDIDGAQENPDTFARIKGNDEDRRLPTVAGRWRDYYENIAAVLQHGATPIVTLSSARRTLQIIDAARRSAQSGVVVRDEIPAAS